MKLFFHVDVILRYVECFNGSYKIIIVFTDVNLPHHITHVIASQQ